MKITKIRRKDSNGITLIALVITIIILLILAAISIATLTGQNGILTQTNKGKTETEIAEEREKVGLVSQELKIEKAQGKEVDEPRFQEMVDSQFGKDKAKGSIQEDMYIIIVEKTGNSYILEENGSIEELGNTNNMKKDENPGTLEKDGTEINSIEDLVAFSYNVNSGTNTYEGKTITLGRSLYFNGLFDSYANSESKYTKDATEVGYIPDETATTTIKELVTAGNGFMPIGNVNNKFLGTFDGKNNFLYKIYINSSRSGLFGQLESGEISNLEIRKGNILSSGIAGSVVGLVSGNVRIENCYNSAEITGRDNSGGIVGFSMGSNPNGITIINCYNTGNITTSSLAGGIIGNAQNLEIDGCYNTGDVTGINKVGGLCGYGTGNIRNSYNTGNVNGKGDGITGGIVGEQHDGKISNCYNKGTIIGNSNTGGIIGNGVKMNIEDSYNLGEVNSGVYAAGIAANSIQEGIISNCYNKGDITGTSITGGIVGNRR